MRIIASALMIQSVCVAYRYSRPAVRFSSIKIPHVRVQPMRAASQPGSIPADQTLYLEQLNPHEFDSLLQFNELLHKYAFDSKPLSQSVTSVISKYFEKFDSEKAVNLMMGGRNWPRPQYCEEDGTPFTKSMILKQWDTVGELARTEGTNMHTEIEYHLNNVPPPVHTPEFSQFLNFKEDVMKMRGVRPYRTEWRIAAPDLSLGGSVDFVGVKEDGSFVLMDWKRSKNLPTSMYTSYGKKCSKPVSNLPDCDGSKYSLQLNMYRYILGKYYGIHVTEMTLASFHPQLDRYFSADVPVMEAEIKAIVNDIIPKTSPA